MPCILVDTKQNALRLVLREPGASPVEARAMPAILDVGAGGRLLGIGLDITNRTMVLPASPSERASANSAGGPLYMPIEPAAEEGSIANVRSAEAEVQILTDANGLLCEVRVPRRGAGYEITYPSGNR